MSRPLRIEYPGACYHVAQRGNGGQPIFTAAEEARRFLGLLDREIGQQRWLCHGWCLMEDGFALLIETPEANLGRGLGRLNMAYSQWFARRHARPGHLFAGRYRAILFEKNGYLAPLAREVVLTPLRAGLVRRADQWHWSSHRALAGVEPTPSWLSSATILAMFGGPSPAARAAWSAYVAAGLKAPPPWEQVRSGQYLGSEPFLRALARRIHGRPLGQVPRAAADPARPTADTVLDAIAHAAKLDGETVLDRRAAPEAYRVAVYLLRRACNLPLNETAVRAGVSSGRISQIQRAVEDSGGLARAYPWAAPLERFLRR